MFSSFSPLGGHQPRDPDISTVTLVMLRCSDTGDNTRPRKTLLRGPPAWGLAQFPRVAPGGPGLLSLGLPGLLERNMSFGLGQRAQCSNPSFECTGHVTSGTTVILAHRTSPGTVVDGWNVRGG